MSFIKKKKIICIIPARSGSKGLKNKNILNFNNKPLIVSTIKYALSCEKINNVIVTTDSSKIANIAKKHFPSVQFSYIEPRKGDIMLTKANIEPLVNLGWNPEVDIEEGIEECFSNLKREINE